jgi:hypothetical protein
VLTRAAAEADCFGRGLTVGLHEQWEAALEKPQERLAAADVLQLAALRVQGATVGCERTALHQLPRHVEELPLQAAALPKLVRELRERYEARVGYGDQAPRIKRLRVAEVVPKRRIQNETDLEEALDALRSAVTEVLGEFDTVVVPP